MGDASDFGSLWARAGLDAVASAPTVRATLRAGPPAGPLELAPTMTGAAETAERLSPELSGTLPTLPPLDLVPSEAADSRHAEFAIVGLLGEGGMGRVLVAHQRSLAREVAVKIRKPEAPSSVEVALLSEARIMGHLEHPSIVPVHALGRGADGSPVIVMKRIDGVLWSTLLADPDHPAWTKLPAASRARRNTHLEILVAVCNAVHFAHSRGIVHRDLKPDNVMVGEFGEVYVTDWGIALVLAAVPRGEPGSIAITGTPAYMAPEMVRGDPRLIDARTDVYLLGAIVHEILTGTCRNPGRSVQEVLRSAYAPTPVVYGATVPEELAALANEATSARPEDRPANVQAFQRRVMEHLHHQGSIALCEAAFASLTQLRVALAVPPAQRTPEAAAAVERLATECRFGFLQALRSWPQNTAAMKGRRECLVALVSDHVARGDAHGARALLGELEAPPELVAQVDALEAENARSAREHEQLAAQARDLDPSVAARERTRFMLMVTGALVLVAAVFLVVMIRGGADVRLGNLVLLPLTLLVVAVAGLATQARRLATTLNRRAAMVVVLGLAMVVVHRLLGLLAGEPVPSVLRADALILAAVFLTVGVTQMGVIAVAGLPLLAVAAFMPAGVAAPVVAFSAAITTAVVLATLGSIWASKRK